MSITHLIEESNLITWILLGLFLISSIIQLAYYIGVYTSVYTHKAKRAGSHKKPVSVIICAKNEAENLIRFLPAVLEQDYPDFEVIVVNDSSTDQTEVVLGEIAGKYPHLRFTSIPANEKFSHGKKLAITVGIKAARHDHLLFIDADCYPAGNEWIKTMAARFSKQKSIVLGYGRYEKRRGLLNALIRYETFFTGMQYLSFAIKGYPYMGVGRNLAYTKELFFENKGFAKHYHLPTGDDDLFINEVANTTNTAVEFSRNSQTVSLPEMRFTDWFKQKQRHLRSGGHYKRASKRRIGTELVSRILLYANLITLCLTSTWFWIVLGIFALVILVKAVVIKLAMNSLNEKQLLVPSLIFDPVMPLLLALIRFSGVFVLNGRTWK
jgi:cellulose synthase/poly-beta-1,6-N-acetylglucosamine synthase-like glycosyltransferase